MKKLLWIFLIIFAVIAGGITLLPKLLPMERIAATLKQQVKLATGRDLEFRDATIAFWPNLGVEITHVTFSNPAWAKEKNMLILDKVGMALALRPLLQRQIEIKHFILEKPVIHLEISANGKKNWDLAKDTKGTSSQPVTEQEDSSGVATMTKNGFTFKFGESKIHKGQLTFVDAQKGGSSRIDNIDMSITLPDLKSPLQLKGTSFFRQKQVELDLNLVQPVDFLQGNASPGHANIKTDDISIKAAGVLATQGEMFNGNVEADVDSLSKFLAWMGGSKEEKLPFEKVSFTSDLHATKTDLILKGADLTLDEVHAKGNMNIGFGGKPDIFARLSLNKLNLDRFTGAKEAGSISTGGADKSNAVEEGWSTQQIDLSGFKAVNADLELKTEGFSVKGVEVGPSILTVLLQNGNLHFKSSEAGLFGGKFGSDLTVNAALTPPTLAFNFDMSGVQAKPILTTFANFKKLSGTADANVSATSSGNSQKSLISHLNGKGSVDFKKGSLEGIDLVNIAQLVQKSLTDMSIGEGKTDFVDLNGTFVINNGIANNTDLKMKGPLLQATGKGTIDLPQKYIQYRVIPVLTASSAVENASGLAVPVDIKGPFSNLKVKPDFASVVQGIAAHPEDAKKTFKNLKDQVQTLKKNPLQTLQNFLGGGLFGKSPAAEGAPATPPAPVPQPSP